MNTKTMTAHVTIYSAAGCGQCAATKRAFARAGIEAELIDITEAETVAAELRAAGWRQLPVVAIDGEPQWAGFRPDLIAGVR